MKTSRGRFCSQPILSRAFHWLPVDYLICTPTRWLPQRAVNVPSQRQRVRAKIWLACKRSSQALPAANFVQNKLHPWQPRLNSRQPALGTSSAFLAQRGRSSGRMQSHPNKSSSCFSSITTLVEHCWNESPLTASCTRDRLHGTMTTADEA